MSDILLIALIALVVVIDSYLCFVSQKLRDEARDMLTEAEARTLRSMDDRLGALKLRNEASAIVRDLRAKL